MLPPGLSYVDSWIDARGLNRCFQLMETEDPTLFDDWIDRWNDLVAFEIVPVIGSAAAAARGAADRCAPIAAAAVKRAPAPHYAGPGLLNGEVSTRVKAGRKSPSLPAL